MKKDLAYYRALRYRMTLDRFVEEEDDALYYRASYEQFPEVKGVDKDRLIAIGLARELFDSLVEARLHWGEEIPEPETPRYREPGGQSKIRLQEPASGSPAANHIPLADPRSDSKLIAVA